MKKTLLILFTFSLLWNCMDDPFENHSLILSGEAGVTEAWLEVHVEGLKRNADYILQRDGKTIFNGRLQTQDTVLYDSLLSPSTTYRYRLYAREGEDISPAEETGLTTLDTTSHDFDWRVYTFGGQKGTSLFYDVAIIDENDIWAVGEIYTGDTYTYDSLGNWIDPYNAAHWDGEKWTLVHISPEFRGKKITPEIEGVFSFNKNDIWFCAGGAPVHWDGISFTMYHLWDLGVLGSTDGGVTKIWGSSYSDIYFVGRTGTMVHYDGTRWTKIETGTEENIRDIWGTVDENDRRILATVVTLFFENERKILRIEEGRVTGTEEWPYTDKKPETLWFKNTSHLFVAGNGVYVKKRNLGWRVMKESVGKYVFNIRGNDINDLFIVGDRKLLMHYNGRTWHNYTYYGYGSLDRVAVKGNLVVAVGLEYPPALIYMGRR